MWPQRNMCFHLMAVVRMTSLGKEPPPAEFNSQRRERHYRDSLIEAAYALEGGCETRPIHNHGLAGNPECFVCEIVRKLKISAGVKP